MLSDLWESYAQLLRCSPDREAPASIERQRLLDNFLCHFVDSSCTEDEPLLFSEMKNVSNELSQELMRNIVTVSNTVDDNDVSGLEEYLLSGRGWMIMFVMHRIGVQGVYNRQDVCNLLLSLLSFPLKIKPREGSPITSHALGIDSQSSHSDNFQLLNLKFNPRIMCHHPVSTKHHTKSRKKKYPASRNGTNHLPPHEESDSEDVSSKKDVPHIRRSGKTLIWSSALKQENSASDDDLGDVYESKPRTIASISSSTLFQLILTLLKDLAILDLEAEKPVRMLSASILPVLLEILHCFTTGYTSDAKTVAVLPWERPTCLELLQQLLRLILLLSNIIAAQQIGLRLLLSYKVIPEVFSALSFCHQNEERSIVNLFPIELSIIQDGIKGCLNLFQVIYIHLPLNPSFIRDANVAMELFRKHGGELYFSLLCEEQDKLFEKEKLNETSSEPVIWLSELLRSLKTAKINYIHAIKCLKRRHKKCDYSFFYHHHHDIFGTTFKPHQHTHADKTLQEHVSACQIAKWSWLMLDCLRTAKTNIRRLWVLHALREEGCCCCLQPSTVINSIVSLLADLSPAVRNFALDTLNTMLLNQFHGSKEWNRIGADKENSSCFQCSISGEVDAVSLGMDSGFSSSDLVDIKNQKTASRWKLVGLLRKYVLSENETVALSVARSLITLAIQGNANIKEELFFGVYMHVLNLQVKGNSPSTSIIHSNGMSPGSASSSTEEPFGPNAIPSNVMLFCVSALPYVLQVDKVMILFLDKGGLQHLTHLLDNDQLRAPVMGVFEALIMIDESAVIAKSLKADTMQQVEYNGGCVIQTFMDTLAQKTCTITAAFQQFQLGVAQSPKNTGNQKRTLEEDLNSLEQIDQHILTTLPVLQDMWHTCAKLCLNSPTFRACYRNSPCLYIVRETLLLALSIISDRETKSMSSASFKQNSAGRVEENVRHLHSFTHHLSKLAFIEAVMIVCFSCHTISPFQKEGEEEDMWLKVRSTLQQCVALEPPKLKAVFDMLLNVAQPQLPSVLEYSYSQITSNLNLKESDELDDEDEVKKVLLHQNEHESETASSELGYEADTESLASLDEHQGLENSSLKNPVSSNPLPVHCFPAVLRLFIELLVASQNTCSGQVVIMPALMRLLHILRNCRATVTAFCKQGLLKHILDGFCSLLKKSASDSAESALQETVLTLIQVIGQVEMTSLQLGLYLKLFLQAQDLRPLLSPLTYIVENTMVRPSACLTFPAKASNFVQSDLPYVHKQDILNEVVALSILQDTQGLSFHGGISVALWLNSDQACHATSGTHLSSQKSPDSKQEGEEKREGSDKAPKIEECIHLVTLVSQSKTLQVWLHISSSTFLFRLTTSTSTATSSYVVLKEASAGFSLSSLSWHLLVISYIDELDGSTCLGKLSVTVDGLLHFKLVLDYPASSQWQDGGSISSIFLGHKTEENNNKPLGQYSLGPVSFFSESKLSSEWWFHLYAMGPCCGSIGKFDCGSHQVNYAGLLHKQVVMHSELSLDVLVGTAPVADVDKARMSLVLYFNPKTSGFYFTFVRDKMKDTTSVLGLVPAASAVDSLLQQRPCMLLLHTSVQLKVSTAITLPQALEQQGGLQAVLFLVAKVFDHETSLEQERISLQVKAVHVLLTLVHHSPHLTSTFANMQCYNMLAVILASSKAVICTQLVKVLYDSATTESVFKFDATGRQIVLRTSTEAIICDPTIISQILLRWQIWQRADESLMESILAALDILVRFDHPYAAFNVRQLLVKETLSVLLHIYLERIQEGLPALSATCGQHVASIASRMVGHPPDLALLATITDFLLEVHPATSGFINCTPAASYLHPVWAVGSTPLTLPALPKKAHKLKAGREVSTGPSLSPSDTGSEMERVHFSSGIETSWENEGGSEGSETGSEMNDPGKSTCYPPIERSSDMYTKRIYLGKSADDSDDNSNFLADGVVEDKINGWIENKQKPLLDEASHSHISTDIMGSDGSLEESVEKLSLSSVGSSGVLVDEDSPDGLDTLKTYLLHYVFTIVNEHPLPAIDAVFSRVINPHVLLILAQSPSQTVRIKVIQVLSAYLWRAPDVLIGTFFKEDGLFLLANQLSAFSVCQQEVEAAISLILLHPFHFLDHQVLGELNPLNHVQQVSPILLLSMLPRMPENPTLCHKTLTVLAQLLESTQVMSTILLDLGIAEALCNLLYTVQNQPQGVDGLKSDNTLLLDVQNIFCLLAVSEFSWSGVVHFQQMESLFYLLQAFEDKEKSRPESSVRWADTTRAFQFAMVVRVLEYVEKLSDELSKTSSSWFTSSSGGLSSNGLQNEHFHTSSGKEYERQIGHKMRHYNSADRKSQSLLQKLFGRRKSLEFIRISQSDLLERFKKFLQLAVDLAVFQAREEKNKPQTQRTLNFLAEPVVSSLDDRYLKHLFTAVYDFFCLTVSKDSFQKKTRNTIFSGVKDVLRIQLSRLLVCILSPRVDFDLRVFAVSFVMGDNQGREIVRLLAGHQAVGTEMAVHLQNLLLTWREWLNPAQRDMLFAFLTMLRYGGYSIFPSDQPLHQELEESLQEDKRNIDARFQQDRHSWISKCYVNSNRVMVKFLDILSHITEKALEITKLMSVQQSQARSQMVEHIKRSLALHIQLKKCWQDVVNSLTHERGVWYHADSYPQSWQLDPTEGPSRARCRLMRCHLGLDANYLLPQHRSKLALQDRDPPLKYLFEDDHQMSDSAILVYKLFTNDTVKNAFVCTAISPSSESKGELLLGEESFSFVADKAIADDNYTELLLGNKDQVSMSWHYTDIVEVLARWFQLQDVALEIFLRTGITHLLSFTSAADRDRVQQLLQSQMDKPQAHGRTLNDIQKNWVDGAVTNFEYLTCLNKLAGRSFNDLMQYPIFPFVLRDYDSDVLNLDDPAAFRDLRKPIAVQEKSREKKYINNYEFLQQELQKPRTEDFLHVEPFHYGSHYSNSGTVLHFLVRLPPFTRMFLAFQDQSFDLPDRTFHSIRTSWKLSSFDSSTDVKELIPEFFFLPEFLLNSEGFDFGVRQNGEQVNDVLLPSWCKNDARLFVLIHRQALESAIATQALNQWIDLVFGYKQKGEEAVKAINVFHPSTYFGMDVTSVSDPLKRQALLTMIRTYGQTPKQLFTTPHLPSLRTGSTSMKSNLSIQREKRIYVPRPLTSVNGLHWGVFVGSPEMPYPTCQKVATLDVPAASLVPIVTGPVFGIEKDSTLITLHTKAAETTSKKADVIWAGVITWNHPDDSLCVITHNSTPLINLMPPNPYDTITCCCAALDSSLLFIAGASGNISVYNMAHNVSKPSTLHVWGSRRILCGHQAEVSLLKVCQTFGVLVTGSKDKTVIIWDINRLSYVRTLQGHSSAITALAVSPTLGDIASASQTESGSRLWVHTINGREVGSCASHNTITCLTYSSSPEGQSVNVIAGGLINGYVRLWSSWDLTHLKDLICETSPVLKPVLSVAYTNSCQALFMSMADGCVYMWQHETSTNVNQNTLFLPVMRCASQRVS